MSEVVQPGDTFGRYEVRRLLGQGGFGAVYLVENELGWTQALKVLREDIGASEEYRTRFLREMAFARTLTHAHGVPIRDAGVVDGNLYFTMDYVEGDDLRKVLKREAPVGFVRLASWAEQILGFLDYIHGKHVIHRDLKPENLILEDPGEREALRVLDLGIAKALESSESMMLSQGVILGTAAYMAPEHLAGDDIDARADLFALSVILYEAATGSHPFTGQTNQQTIGRVLHRDLPPLHRVRPGFPGSFSAVIAKGLAKSRDDRHPTARAYADAVRSLRGELEAVERAAAEEDYQPTVPLRPAERRAARPRKGLVLGAGGTLVVLGLGAVLWMGGGDDPAPAEDDGATELAQLDPFGANGRAAQPSERGGDPDEVQGRVDPRPEDGPSDGDRPGLGDSVDAGAAGAAEDGAGIEASPGESRDDRARAGDSAASVPTAATESVAASFPAGFGPVPPGLVAAFGATSVDAPTGLPTPIHHAATGLVLTLVPASSPETFWIGLTDEEEPAYREFPFDDRRNEPARRVEVTRPFYIGATEVAYRNLAGFEVDRSWWDDEIPKDELEAHPVIGMTWQQARAFCEAHGMRLPTEAEWAWCARVESADGLFVWGDGYDPGRCNGKGGEDGAAYTRPVLEGQPTERLGLYNLLGNVWEYCDDAYSATRFGSLTDGFRDPHFGRTSDAARVARGGSFREPPEFCRISARLNGQLADIDIGLRVALDAVPR